MYIIKDLRLISKMVVALFIIITIALASVGMNNFNKAMEVSVLSNKESIINKALIQAYALEGGFPTSIFYLESYGIIFDTENYMYYYTLLEGNINPHVNVVPLN
jgi:hypothetical protein